MFESLKRALLPGLLMLGVSGCGDDSVVVWLHLQNVTPDVTALQVAIGLDGKPAMQQYEFTQGLGEVAIKLRNEQLGQGKRLGVSLYGLRADRCRVVSGQYTASVNADQPLVEAAAVLGTLIPVQCPEVRPNLVKVPKGIFTMGSPTTESGRSPDETQHTVTLTRDFWMAESEVTQKQYRNFMGSSPSAFKGDDLPVEQVSWFDAVAYCNALSVKEKLTPCYQISGTTVGWAEGVACNGYRLPTEAEWEYAARSPATTVYAGSDSVDGVAWYITNSGSTTHAVKTKAGNVLRLYDLSGNVWEWVWDGYQSDYQTLPSTDPIGASASANRVFRGGSWYLSATYARVARRGALAPADGGNGIGFRIVRSSP